MNEPATLRLPEISIQALVGINRRLAEATCGGKRVLLPWVAEILGSDRAYKLSRRFLRSFRDYAETNCKGTRGVCHYYYLHPGRVYEVCSPTGWNGAERYFCKVEGGEVVRITEQMVLESVEAKAVEEIPAASAAPSELDTILGTKHGLGINVLQAAQERIAFVFDHFPKVYVSFSGGKDSTVMLHLVMDEAIKRGRKVGVLLIDLEAQYEITISHARAMFDRYRDHIDPFWISLPLHLRNAVSMYEPHWICWDKAEEERWVRRPPEGAITEANSPLPWFRHGMEFEEFVEEFGHWYGGDQLTACFVGIRADESLNRFRAVARSDGFRFEGRKYTTWKSRNVFNVYPIYDWRTEDIWTFNAKTGLPYNHLYDLMHQAGLTIHQQRICQPYGDDQRKGLWLYHVIEPETWGRVVARVNGANSGALYAQETGNILGRLKITKPPGHTWKSFAKLLLESLPAQTREHYEGKIAVFLHWWAVQGGRFGEDYTNGIPDELDPRLENAPGGQRRPSWRRICWALLRNDYWCKGLSFSQTNSAARERYRRVMQRRMQRWGTMW